MNQNENDGLIQHSVMRVRKKIIDFIMINYDRLFSGNTVNMVTTIDQEDFISN